MDDLTINIDELILDGAVPPDQEAIAAAIRQRAGENLDPQIVADVSRAVARSLSPVSPAGEGS